jgi:hypothetical protein
MVVGEVRVVEADITSYALFTSFIIFCEKNNRADKKHENMLNT